MAAAARASMARHVEAMLAFKKLGIPVFDYGNNIRQVAFDEGVKDAFAFPGFVPAYVRPLFCRGVGPFRWVALSGDPEDIYRTDAKVRELMPHDAHLHHWLDMARERIQFQGLPARICWVGLGDRHRLGLAFNEMVAKGELKAPIVIGRDHLDSGSVASPNRETEAMRDGSDAVADWPLLNALLNTASGATWVSIHHGGGVGMGYSQHAGVVIVCDGTPEAARRIERVLWNDPASGVMRHADAGYEIAIACAREQGLNLPFLGRPARLAEAHLAGRDPQALAQRAARDLRCGRARHRARRPAHARRRASSGSGPRSELPRTRAAEVHDLGGAWVTPGLIDCHTHLVFAGTRAGEYAERLRGRSYEEIARAGGGILSSVRAVRAASEQQLFDESAPRLAALASEGVTTLEIKSGYGLTLADEAKMLRVARAPRAGLPGHGAHDAARRAHPAAGVPRPRRRVHRHHRARVAAGPARGGAGRRRGRLLRAHRLQRRAGGSGCSPRRARSRYR